MYYAIPEFHCISRKPWKRQCGPVFYSPGRAMQYCCPRHVPVLICSRITFIAPSHLTPRSSGSRKKTVPLLPHIEPMIYQQDISKPRNLPDFDQALIWSAIFLLSLGLVMVYSAS